jgi:hypothetical protein
MTRSEAKALGLTQYVSEKPCKRGHTSEKHVREGCLECRKKTKLSYYERHPKRRWAKSVAAKARYRTRKSGNKYPCTITAAYIHSIAPDACPIFGTEFVFIGQKTCMGSATLDRLVPELGYVPGNIAVISMKANSIKNAYRSEDILKVGKWLKSRGL